MIINVHARARAACLAILLCAFGLPVVAAAQTANDKVHVARRLGGSSQFTRPIVTDAVQSPVGSHESSGS